MKKLDKLWDEEYQPQKGLAIRRLMDAATRRLVELKDMLVEIDMHEYHYVDGAYIQLHLIPREFEVLDLQSLPKERDPELQEMIEALIKRGISLLTFNPVGAGGLPPERVSFSCSSSLDGKLPELAGSSTSN